MKKTIALILTLSVISGFADGLNKTLNITTAETYVRLYPRDGYLQIKEYSLSATSSRTSTEKVKSLIANAKYCKKRFKFKQFTALEESMKHDRDFITGEYHLMTRDLNLVKMMEDCFGKILDRKVRVTIDESSIGLHYTGSDIQVRSNNAEGAYEKGDQRVIFWKNGLQYFEVVFGETANKQYNSIANSFGSDVSSPEKSEAEISKWKNKPSSLMEKIDVKYQHDADIFRLRHLEYFGGLIEEYHQKTGKYPLQENSEYQNYVHIAAPHQQKYATGGPSHKHNITNIETFRKELEQGLGRTIDLKFDPQKVPVDAPNFYIYMIEGDSYYFAIHLYHEFPFSNSIAKHYNKVEITNVESRQHGQWKFEDLQNNLDFKTSQNEKPYKEAFFKTLEEKYR